VAPLFGHETIERGAAVRKPWAGAGRAGEPRIVTGSYLGLGPDGERVASEYLALYHGAAHAHLALAETPTTLGRLRDERQRLETASATDVVLYPGTARLDQVQALVEGPAA
jgi:hypothetical protein